jgi:hypothetical protein
MRSKSIKGKSTTEIETVLVQIMSVGFKPSMAVVFYSKIQDINALLDSKNIEIFGATTNGEFIDQKTAKKYAAVLLLDIKTAYFHLYFENTSNKEYREVATAVAIKAKYQFKKSAFFIGFSIPQTNWEEILHSLEDFVGIDVNAFNGNTGDDYSFIETFVLPMGK